MSKKRPAIVPPPAEPAPPPEPPPPLPGIRFRRLERERTIPTPNGPIAIFDADDGWEISAQDSLVFVRRGEFVSAFSLVGCHGIPLL